MGNILNFKNWLINESRMILEQNPNGSTMSSDTAAKIDAAIAAAKALVTPINGLTFKGTGQAKGVRNFTVSDVKLAKDQDKPDVYVAIDFSGSSFEIYFGADTKDNKTPVIARNGKFIGDPTYSKVVYAVTGQNVHTIASEGYTWVKNYMGYEENKAQWDKIAAAITNVANKYISSGGIATK